MACPMFIDYCRECLNKIDFLPANTLNYCETDRHTDCPFFRTINDAGVHCGYIEKCPAYKHFGVRDFEKFVKMTNQYCLSENNVNCERFKLRKEGREVPSDLLPDGAKIDIKQP